MPRTLDRLYSHSDAVAILRIAPDRLRNFMRVPAYAGVLSPAQHVGGRGRGTRLMYGWTELCKLAVADSLLTAGWQPSEVARAAAALTPHDFRLPRDWDGGSEPPPSSPVLLYYRGRWSVWRAADVAERDWSDEVVYIYALLPIAIDVAKQIETLEADGAVSVRKPKRPNPKGVSK